MRKPKFNFIPERQLNKKAEMNDSLFTVALYTSGQLVFSSEVIDTYELENKFIRLFCDTEQKAIGWSVVEGELNSDNGSDLRQVVKDVHFVWKTSVRKLLTALNYGDIEKSITMPIGQYKSTMHEGVIYYVTLPPKEAVITLNGETQSTSEGE